MSADIDKMRKLVILIRGLDYFNYDDVADQLEAAAEELAIVRYAKTVHPKTPLSSKTEIVLKDGECTFPVTEIDLSANNKYIISVDIGGLHPKEAMTVLERYRIRFTEFFGQTKIIVYAFRKGQRPIEIYEVEGEANCAKSLET